MSYKEDPTKKRNLTFDPGGLSTTISRPTRFPGSETITSILIIKIIVKVTLKVTYRESKMESTINQGTARL